MAPRSDMERPDGRVSRRAYPLLVFTALVWGGNAVASRMAVGQVSPMALTSLRWLVACAALVPFAGRQVAREWHRLRPAWPRITAMGAGGFTGFTALFYAAGAYTSATNIALIQGSIPVLVLVIGFLSGKAALGPVQLAGVALTVVGVLVAASHGNLAILRTLAFNRGDFIMLAASAVYAGYTVALRSRPAVPQLVFFSALALVALVSSLPLLAAEWVGGHLVWPTAWGWLVVLFVGLGPSLTSQLTYMRGVALIGPDRAAVFVNLLPVFGALLAILVLGEPLRGSTLLALALVLGGIAVVEGAERRRRVPGTS